MSSHSSRLLSLDIMRGATIAAMILVNMPGSWSYVLPWLEHSPWHGITPADFIFPFFLFMVGVSMALSLDKITTEHRELALGKILKRSLSLFVIGWTIHVFPFFNFAEYWSGLGELQTTIPNSRIPGVLQRIGICYAIVGTAMLFLRTMGLGLMGITILVGYQIALVCTVPNDPYGISHNLVGIVDTMILGTAHLWDKTNSFDPEGLLSTLPATVNVIVGVFAGRYLKGGHSIVDKVKTQLHWGVLLLMIGLIWSLSFPLNKNLWTSTFVLTTSGTALITLGLLTWLIDHRGMNGKWTHFFQAYGSNALFAYCFAEIWSALLYAFFVLPNGKSGWQDSYSGLFQMVFQHIGGPWIGSLLFSVVNVLFTAPAAGSSCPRP